MASSSKAQPGKGAVRLISVGVIAAMVVIPLMSQAASRAPVLGDMFTFAGGGPPDGYGDDGPATSATFKHYPVDVDFDGEGNAYIVTGLSHNTVRKVDVEGNIKTVAGGGTSPVSAGSGPATSAELIEPSGVTVGPDGDIYIAERAAIRRVDASGLIHTVAGTGTRGFSGDGELATAAQMRPRAVAVDGTRNIFIADFGNNRIRRVDALSGIITTVAGGGDGYGEERQATEVGLGHVWDVDVDNGGDLFLVNGSRISRVDHESGKISTFAGTGDPCYGCPTIGDGGSATAATLRGPHSLSLDPLGNLFISDSSNFRIRKVDTAGIISTVAGGGDEGLSADPKPATSTGFDPYHPLGMNVDPTGAFAGVALEGQGPYTPWGCSGRPNCNPSVAKILVAPPKPAVHALSPNAGPTAGGTSLTITGRDLAPVSAISFGADSFTCDQLDCKVPTAATPGTQLIVTTPKRTASTVPIKIITPDGDSAVGPKTQFTYRPPLISGVNPPQGAVTGGTPITIAGSDLDQSLADFGGSAGTDLVPGSDSIIGTTPAHARGLVDLVVTTPSGDTATAPFTYLPVINAISPPSGRLEGGTEVTILGDGFLGTTQVQFGEEPPLLIEPSESDTEITLQTPSHNVAESVPVTLSVAGLNSIPANIGSNLFTYTAVGPRKASVGSTGGLPADQNNASTSPPPTGTGPAAGPGVNLTSSTSTVPGSVSSSSSSFVPTASSIGLTAPQSMPGSNASNAWSSPTATKGSIQNSSFALRPNFSPGSAPGGLVIPEAEAEGAFRHPMVGRSNELPLEGLAAGAGLIMFGACFATWCNRGRGDRAPKFQPQRA